MLDLKTILFLVSSVLLSSAYKVDKEQDKSRINCNIQRRCSTIEEIVWATDYKQCYLFRNPCLFANEMCVKRDNKQEEYKVVTEADCKVYCHDICPDIYAPVCGEYDNAYKTFSNECDFFRQSCQNNQSYIFLQKGECNQAVVD